MTTVQSIPQSTLGTLGLAIAACMCFSIQAKRVQAQPKASQLHTEQKHSGRYHEHETRGSSKHWLSSEHRKKFHARKKAMRSKMLRKRVGLSEKKAQELEAVFQSYEKPHREIRQQMREHRRKLKALLELDSSDHEAYTRSLSQLRDGHQRMHALREEKITKLTKALSPKQQAKLMIAMGDIRKRLGKKIHGKRWHRRNHHRHDI